MTDALVWGVIGLLLGAASAFVIFGRYRRQPLNTAASAGMASNDAEMAGAGSLISIELLGDPALLVDANMRVILANAAARELFGARIAGEDLRLALRNPAVIDAARAALASAGPAEAEVSGLGGVDDAYRVRAVAFGAANRQDRRLLLTFADVTQARLMERMRVDFVANASHELRTPLATLLGFIETLQGPAADDEPARRRFLDIMAREAARMARLIDDLLSLSRIELDKYIRPQTALSVVPLITETGRTLAMRFEADHRSFETEIEADLPPVIADRDQIMQVLHNLVSNALKYGQSGTVIAVSAHRKSDSNGNAMVQIAVQDRGEGIPPEHLPRLTERFYRVDTSRSRSMGGTGLGLAIAKHIIERHRGVLEISSAAGEGTRVAFTLPVAPDQG